MMCVRKQGSEDPHRYEWKFLFAKIHHNLSSDNLSPNKIENYRKNLSHTFIKNHNLVPWVKEQQNLKILVRISECNLK